MTTIPQVNQEFPVGTIRKRKKDAKRDRMKVRVESSVTVKVGEIDEKIREGESRRMRKEMVGYLTDRTPLPRHTSFLHRIGIS